MARVSSTSKPWRVPSRSIDVTRISPAPRSAHSLRPGHGVLTRLAPAAVGVDLPPRARGASSGVDGDDDALRAELVGQPADQGGIEDGGGVQRHLVGAGPQQPAGVVGCPDSSAHGEGDEYLLRGTRHHVHHRVALVRRSRDVEKDELVGTFGVIARRQLHGIAGIDEVDEAHALHDPSGIDVEARDHTDGTHAAIASSTVMAPSTNAVPTMAPARRRRLGPDVSGTSMSANVDRSAGDRTPPDATTGARSTRARPATPPGRGHRACRHGRWR